MRDVHHASGQPERDEGVTVMLATRDRLLLLDRALRAIWAQTWEGPVQVVVVFDGPVPADARLPQPLHPERQSLSVFVNERSAGVAGARNTALSRAEHDLIATCDDDDVWLPDRLSVQVRDLAAHPEALAVGGSVRVIRGAAHVVRRSRMREVRFNDLLDDRIMELHPSAMLYRREGLEKVAGWDEEMPGGYAEDYDLLLRLARHGGLRMVGEVVADIHWGSGSYFFGRWQMIEEALTLLLDRFPEFAGSPRGHARIAGQIAFACAARGDRAGARRWMRAAWCDNHKEPRLLLTGLVLGGVSADRIQGALHRRGRGI